MGVTTISKRSCAEADAFARDNRAPLEWYYANLPRRSADAEELFIDWLVDLASELLDCANLTSDDAYVGRTLHWAHMLKTMQASDGSWPATVSLRSGEVLGDARTLAPAGWLARLGKHLDSTEFEAVVARAASHRVVGEAPDREQPPEPQPTPNDGGN